MKILSCDLETTGLRPMRDDWIVGSFGILDYETLETLAEKEINSRPNNWSQEAFEIHKIREDVAMRFQSRNDALEELIDFIPKEPFVFLCHARPHNKDGFYHFDLAFLKMDFAFTRSIYEFYHYFDEISVISTQTIAAELRKKGVLGVDKTNLKCLSEHFNIKLNHHNANSDRLACEEILRRFRDIEKNRFI